MDLRAMLEKAFDAGAAWWPHRNGSYPPAGKKQTVDALLKEQVQPADAVKAYGELWALIERLHRENRHMNDAEAEWFYTTQPESVWTALRAAGLDPSEGAHG